MTPKMRDAYARTYRPILQRGIQTVVNEEVEAVRAAIKSGEGFNRVYLETIPRYIRSRVRPTQFAYGQDIIKASANETGLDFTEDGALLGFIGAYADVFSQRYVSSHLDQLKSLQSMDAVKERLAEWQAKDAGKRAANEITRENQSVFRQCIFSKNMSVVWHTRGESCPYCNRLSGRKINKQNPFFVKKMEVLDPGVKDKKPMTVYQGCGHPPLHPG